MIKGYRPQPNLKNERRNNIIFIILNWIQNKRKKLQQESLAIDYKVINKI